MNMSNVCEIALSNATPDEIRDLLAHTKRIAVVGLSDKPDRPSYEVAAYMQQAGYRLLPVNPQVQGEILGEKVYASLSDIPEPVDLVNIFRRPEAVPALVEEAIRIGAKAIWMQEGIVHNAAAELARANGLKVVMDRCLLREHRRLAQDASA
jgi:predicted CoA-binding protein